jgi:hypothetical protein
MTAVLKQGKNYTFIENKGDNRFITVAVMTAEMTAKKTADFLNQKATEKT